jgi:sortase (surface protein transpeptidase)
VSLDIPSLQIDTALLKLGLNHDGTLQVPWKPLLAGWYTGSPTPGELGPAIIAGHVDSWATGPAVFYRLGQVAVGARVRVTRADSSVADFQVTAVRTYPKVAFPTDVVYGNVDRAELRLITCGTWNSTTQEYDGNVVVFADLVRPRQQP